MRGGAWKTFSEGSLHRWDCRALEDILTLLLSAKLYLQQKKQDEAISPLPARHSTDVNCNCSLAELGLRSGDLR